MGLTLNLDGRKYEIEPMPPMEAVPFAHRFARLISGAAGGLAALAEIDEKEDSDDSKAIAALSGVVGSIDVDEYNRCVSYALRKGLHFEETDLSEIGAFNRHFKAHPSDAIAVCLWMVWGHVSPFLLGAAPKLQELWGWMQGEEQPLDSVPAKESKYRRPGKTSTG